MPDGQTLEFAGVTKRFGSITAVSDLTARIEPGRVTGFLGPNGAGKTTTLRVLLGLIRATAGSATIGGSPYARLREPLRTVGAVLEASSYHPGHTAATHLKAYARAGGIPIARVDEVLGLVGLADAAGRKIGGFSLGMRQRLGLAYALLGDPGVLVLDEPANGLDPEGIRWMRGFLRQLAREGRTVLVSSHLLAEVQQTVDALLIISSGRLVFSGDIDQLAPPDEYATVVDAPDRAALTGALRDADVSFDLLRSGLVVPGLSTVEVGALAASAGVALSVLQRRGPALEEVFLELVNGTRVHTSAAGAAVPVVPGEPESIPGPEGPAGPEVEGEREPAPEPEPDVEAAPEPEPEAAPEPEPDVEAAPEPEPEAEPELEPDVEAAPEPEPEAELEPPAAGGAEAEPAPEPERASDEGPEPDPPADASAGQDGDESPAPAPPDDRPWESFVKTDADEAADRFFASFDGAQPEDASGPQDDPHEGGDGR